MSSPNAAVEREDTRQNAAGVGALLDVAFGYFVWAAHFLLVYIATAVSCQLALGVAEAGSRTAFLFLLAVVTVVAAAVVLLHAARRYRQHRDLPRQRFRMTVTIGNDAIATVTIAWQLLAVVLVPLCA
jgi:hypothetical protein